jgi:uncharacterized protein (DUF58 family)
MAPVGAVTPDRVLRRLEWHVIRRLDGRLQGSYRTLLPGSGIDFKDLRDYEAGDDIRHIDWNVTARMDSPFVRQYIEDRELEAWVLADRSASMSFGPVHRPKAQVLVEVATVLTQLLARGGNRVGAILYDDGVQALIPPRQGRNQVLRITRELLREREPARAPTDLSGLLRAAQGVIRRRSLVFVVSDFISAPGWERPLGQLNQRNEVVAIRLLDPRELELPDAGMVVIEDTETGEQLFVDTSNPLFRRRLRAEADAREARLEASARRAGVELATISTGEDLLAALARLAERRRRRRR